MKTNWPSNVISSRTATYNSVLIKPDHIVPEGQPWMDDDILIEHTTSSLLNDNGGNIMKRSFSDTTLFAIDPVAFA